MGRRQLHLHDDTRILIKGGRRQVARVGRL